VGIFDELVGVAVAGDDTTSMPTRPLRREVAITFVGFDA